MGNLSWYYSSLLACVASDPIGASAKANKPRPCAFWKGGALKHPSNLLLIKEFIQVLDIARATTGAKDVWINKL